MKPWILHDEQAAASFVYAPSHPIIAGIIPSPNWSLLELQHEAAAIS